MRFACDIRIAATGITSNDKQFLKGENSYESSKSDGNLGKLEKSQTIVIYKFKSYKKL